MTSAEKVWTILRQGPRNLPGASVATICTVESDLGVLLPQDYCEFLQQSDGWEGPIGDAGCLMLWAIRRLPAIQRAGVQVPGLLVIGSTGGGILFCMRTSEGRTAQYLSLDGDLMEPLADLGSTFLDLLNAIERDELW